MGAVFKARFLRHAYRVAGFGARLFRHGFAGRGFVGIRSTTTTHMLQSIQKEVAQKRKDSSTCDLYFSFVFGGNFESAELSCYFKICSRVQLSI